jgi:2-polyprenyl-3-methyl-5-hydroxy-6-metoxy-1,4-benzoquinol methylase
LLKPAIDALKEWRNDFRLVVNLVRHTPEIRESSQDYDAYWKEKRANGTMGRPGIFQVHRAGWILPMVEDGDTVAEYGCGDAAILAWIASRRSIQPIGIDISEYALSFAREMGIETRRLNPDSPDYGVLPEADVYLLLEVLEHMADPEAMLRRILPKARKKVIVSIPNTGFFPYRFRLLLGSFPVQWRIHPGEHLRYWTLGDFRWWLGQLGLEGCSRVEAYKGVPVLNKILPGLFGMGLICEIRCNGSAADKSPDGTRPEIAERE